MTHLWIRAEQRPNEERVGITPDGCASLLSAGIRVTVEESPRRAIPIDGYRDAGCTIAPEGSWPRAPGDAIIFGLKELPDDGAPLGHRHIMFGHAYKGQPAGRALLARFLASGGILYDLEYLVDENGRRVAAFGHWAGYAGAAVALLCRAAQHRDSLAGPITRYRDRDALVDHVRAALADAAGARPDVLVIGALGRVGAGATALCDDIGVAVTRWDIAETARGGPFPEILAHEVFLNCILAGEGGPVFVPAGADSAPRRLRVIGDIACDPGSAWSPIKIYDRATDWSAPALRVHDDPPLDIMAIDNLPSLLPLESSRDFSAELLPSLAALPDVDAGVWARARAEFERHVAALSRG